MTIYKYKIQNIAQGPQTTKLSLPWGAKILSVGAQDDELVLWAAFEGILRGIQFRIIQTYWTGDHLTGPIPTDTFLGTVTDRVGLVWHIFEAETE